MYRGAQTTTLLGGEGERGRLRQFVLIVLRILSSIVSCVVYIFLIILFRCTGSYAGNSVQNSCLTYFYPFIANKPPPGLLEFRSMQKKLPWNIIVLLGSGFALAEACKVRNSGADLMGDFISCFPCVQRLRVSLIRSILRFPVNLLGEGT